MSDQFLDTIKENISGMTIGLDVFIPLHALGMEAVGSSIMGENYNNVSISLTYHKELRGGRRGFLLNVSPAHVGGYFVRRTIGDGQAIILHEVGRISDKAKRDALSKVTPDQVAEMIVECKGIRFVRELETI